MARNIQILKKGELSNLRKATRKTRTNCTWGRRTRQTKNQGKRPRKRQTDTAYGKEYSIIRARDSITP